MFRLGAAVQNYDWGSPTAIPEFLGESSAGEPVAELWFGTHALGASVIETPDGTRPLADVVGDLPFMLKVLAPAKPLSIQVHPAQEQAEAGFAAEEAAGLLLANPTRDFKDPFHKPEMVYALTPFETLVGLRPVDEVRALLTPLREPIADALLAHDGVDAMVDHLLNTTLTSDDVGSFVGSCIEEWNERDVARGYDTVLLANEHHPGDPGVVLALLLNRVTLPPGESAFIGPGLIHAHMSGLCLEVMAPSDNVVRAGLTPKRVNVQGVLESLRAADDAAPFIKPERVGAATEIHAPALGLFALSVTRGAEAALPGSGHRLLLCLDGDVQIGSASGDSVTLRRGQAAFASADDGALEVRGTGTIAQAYVPGR